MCGLLLLEAAKKVDQEFQVPCKSSHHTTRSAENHTKCLDRDYWWSGNTHDS